MRSLKNLVVFAKFYLTALMAIAVCAGGMAYAESSGSTVQFMVCPGKSQSFLTVTSPQSDSVTGSPHMTVMGSVQYISQIDFYIDEAYDATIALGLDDVSYQETLTLEPGTHTIKVVAHDSCHATTHTQSLVVTYEPAVNSNQPTQTPGAGKSSPGGSSIRPGASVDGQGVELVPSMQSQGLPERAATALRQLISDIGLTTQKGLWSVRDYVDLFLILLALAVLLFPRKFARRGLKMYVVIRQKLFAAAGYIKRQKKRSLPQHAVGWTRFIGVVLILIVFI